MKKLSKHFKKYIHHYIISLIVILSLGILFWSLSTKESARLYEVKKTNLVSTVSFSGSVVPAEDVELSFESSGTVKFAPFDVDQPIKRGNILAYLNDEKLQTQIEQVEANINEARSSLEKIKSPARDEDISLQESKITFYQTNLSNQKEKMVDSYKSMYTEADNLIRGYVDKVYNSPRTSPNLKFQTDNQQEISLEKDRSTIEKILIDWKTKTIYANKENVESYLFELKEDLSAISVFLSDLALSVNSLESSSTISQTTIDTWKSNLITSREGIDTSSINITNLISTLDNLKSSLNIEQKALEVLTAPAKKEDIEVAQAKIDSLNSLLNNYKANLTGLQIIAPIDGVISKYDLREGESVPSYKNVISIISNMPLEVESDLSELDVPYVKVGDKTDITLDAYGDSFVFGGVVTSVDSVEKNINNLPTYKVRIKILDESEKILTGMSTQITSMSWQKDGVLAIPLSAVETEGDNVYVLKFNEEDNKFQKILITPGKIADGGMLEILGGLIEGDRVKLEYNVQ